MTSSVVNICNRALAEMGARSTIASLTEASTEALQCSLWYDNCRQGLLRAAPWGFARMQVTLTELGDLSPDNTSPYPWLFKYAYPADAIKFRYVLAPPAPVADATVVPQVGIGVTGPTWLAPSRSNRYIISGDKDPANNPRRVLLTNVCQAMGVYTYDVTDPNQFDPMFESALTAALAYKLVIPLSGNVAMRQQFRESAEGSILNARVADGNEAIPTTDHTPDWILTRGVESPCGVGAQWGLWTARYDDFNWGS